MDKNGPVIVIEDDADDQEILRLVFEKLAYSNEVIFFNDGDEALAYLQNITTKPFLILSDINMPKLNGMDLRDKIFNNAQLNLRCIPYLFFTTAAEQPIVLKAYSKSVQGFFVKPTGFSKIENTIALIMKYWKECHSPSL